MNEEKQTKFSLGCFLVIMITPACLIVLAAIGDILGITPSVGWVVAWILLSTASTHYLVVESVRRIYKHLYIDRG